MTNPADEVDLSVLTCLRGVVHVVYPDAPDWLVAVQFRFDEGYLGIEVNPDDDTVDVTFERSAPPPLRYWAVNSVSRDATGHYADVLGLASAWRWVLRNQQGYQDAFQIELGPATATVTFQYLALASRLCLRRVTDAPVV